MNKAFDCILEIEVDATSAANNSEGDEPYLFECSYCGEEVHLAAAKSLYRVPHFRHRHGNNDTECENYLRQHRELSWEQSSRKSNRENVAFYYHSNNSTFSIGIRFSEKEIVEYEQQGISLEVLTDSSANIIETKEINHLNFYGNATVYIPLCVYSDIYQIQTTASRSPRDFKFLKSGSAPIVFKILGNDDNYKAKLVGDKTLFTNVRYLVILHSRLSFPQLKRSVLDEIITKRFQFETMNRKFLGIEMTIESKTIEVESELHFWGYQLEASESLTLLWPPARCCDEGFRVASDYAYIHSSFELQAHGNINVQSSSINKLDEGITVVEIKPNTKIFRRNAEIVIDKDELACAEIKKIKEETIETEQLRVPDGRNQFVLFDKYGTTVLKHGQSIQIVQNSEIKKYSFTYLIGRYYLPPARILTGQQLLEDILRHNKCEVEFCSDDFLYCELTDTASKYLIECSQKKTINGIARRLILEGSL